MTTLSLPQSTGFSMPKCIGRRTKLLLDFQPRYTFRLDSGIDACHTWLDIYSEFCKIEKRQWLKLTFCEGRRDEYYSISDRRSQAARELFSTCSRMFADWARLYRQANRLILQLHHRCPITFRTTETSLFIHPEEMTPPFPDFDEWFGYTDSDSQLSEPEPHQYDLQLSDSDGEVTVINISSQDPDFQLSDSDSDDTVINISSQPSDDVMECESDDSTFCCLDVDPLSTTIVGGHVDMYRSPPDVQMDSPSSRPVLDHLSSTLSSAEPNRYTLPVINDFHVSDTDLDDTVFVYETDNDCVSDSLMDVDELITEATVADSSMDLSYLVANLLSTDFESSSPSVYTELASDTDLDATVVQYTSDNDCVAETCIVQ